MQNDRHEGNLHDSPTLCPARDLFGALLVAAGFIGGATLAVAADGGSLFKEKCAACHSVGAGAMVGPDLKDVVTKLGVERTILAIVDPAKAGLAPTMPKLGLTQSEAQAVTAFLDGREPKASTTAGTAQEPEAEATPLEASVGGRLFEGSARFANGGPACNACHNVTHETVAAGGILASDLTQSFSRMDARAFGALLANAPFPVMQVAYEGKAIKPEEVRALAGFLQRVGNEGVARKPGDPGWGMFLGGAAGVLVLAGFFWLIGARRKKRCVNQEIYDRQIKSE
jgi:cytochrome c2